MPANSPIPFPDSRSEALSIPASDQGAVIPNPQSDSSEGFFALDTGKTRILCLRHR